MNLFDRVKLLIRSTVSGALGGSLPDLTDIASNERSDRLLDKAQARVEMLQQDLARAEQRGDAELADRLRREINDLQKTLDKARRKAGQLAVPQSAPSQASAPSTTPTAEVKGGLENKATGDAQPDAADAADAANEGMDNSRVADQIRKMREGGSQEPRER